eukprot:79549_1
MLAIAAMMVAIVCSYVIGVNAILNYWEMVNACDSGCNNTECNFDEYDCVHTIANYTELCRLSFERGEHRCNASWIGDVIAITIVKQVHCVFLMKRIVIIAIIMNAAMHMRSLMWVRTKLH